MASRAKPLRIGIAGLGTVGSGVLALLARDPDRFGPLLTVAGVSARSRSVKRAVDISPYAWFDDPVEMAESDDIDVLVELIGGSDGPAKRAVEVALARGAHVVTANKALLAEHGADLAALAEAQGASLAFEAAVGGGMPVVKAVRESLAAADIQSISGILNGTCNFLLTEMERSGRSYEEVLAEAQRLGYAEADPSFDVGGIDAAHKITLLAAIAFSTPPDFSLAEIEGVEGVTLLDIQMAQRLGYRIKLLAKAERLGQRVRIRVHPALVGLAHPLASVGGALNAALVDADPIGQLSFVGRGAGSGPTAVAVLADLLDIVEGRGGPPFGRPHAALRPLLAAKPAEIAGKYYLRLLVSDRAGVIAAVSNALATAGVSIESFLQSPTADGSVVPIVLTTRTCPRPALDAAVAAIARLDDLTEPPRVFPVEDTYS